MSPEPRLGIVYEHPQWFVPLFAELDHRDLPYDRVDLSVHQFDPAVVDVPWSIVFNRLSPSAYLRGHGPTIVYGRELLHYLEAAGVDVVNGWRAFMLETSKVAQFLLLRQLGLQAPPARVINHPSQAPKAAQGLTFPVIVKPNIGGSGAGIQRFDSVAALAEVAARGTIDLGIDQTALVQEFLPPRDGHIVRVEILDGRFLYAIKVYPDPNAGFNLCPADICHPAGMAQPVPPPVVSADLCPVDLPKVALKVEGYTPPAQVVREVLRIAGAAGLDLGGVEYLVNDRDGQVYYYDINVLSNFVTDAERVVGLDPYEALVEYLERRGKLRSRKSRAPAIPV